MLHDMPVTHKNKRLRKVAVKPQIIWWVTGEESDLTLACPHNDNEWVWVWDGICEQAFTLLKYSLALATVRGHPMRGRSYRLYTDASDIALAGALQQVQPIEVGDLQGSRTYEWLKEAYEKGEPVLKLVTKIDRTEGEEGGNAWGNTLDKSIVLVERVIAYWSWVCKGPETHYSAMEREALAAKEALVKFMPFIEGEELVLITDHVALQWARTFESYNCCLAGWD